MTNEKTANTETKTREQRQIEKAAEIKKLQELLPTNEKFVKKGKTYHRFLIQEVKLPEGLEKAYLSISYNKNNVPCVVLNYYEGISEEEKEKKKQERTKLRAVKQVEKLKLLAEIKVVKTEIKGLVREYKFSECEKVNVKLDALLKKYNDSFGRKRK